MIGSSLLRNDESVLSASPIDDAAAALPCAAATRLCAIAWLGLFGSAAAAATACWNSGVAPADCSAPWILSGSELNSSDRKTATPERAAELPEERRRRGRDAHVLGRHGVLHRDQHGLHAQARGRRRSSGSRCRAASTACRR